MAAGVGLPLDAELSAVVASAPLPAVARAAALFGGPDNADTPAERFLFAHFEAVFDGRPSWDSAYALVDGWVAALGTITGVDAVTRTFGCHLHDNSMVGQQPNGGGGGPALPPLPTVAASGQPGVAAVVALSAAGAACRACHYELSLSAAQRAQLRHKAFSIGTTSTSLVAVAALLAESAYRRQCEAAAQPPAQRARAIVISRRVGASALAFEKNNLYTAYVLLAKYLERRGLAGCTVARDDAESWSAWFHNRCTFTLTMPVSTAAPT